MSDEGKRSRAIALLAKAVTERPRAPLARKKTGGPEGVPPAGARGLALVRALGAILLAGGLTPLQPAAAQDVAALLRAYPQFLERIEGNVLVWTDGTRMTIDDGKGVKSHEALLASPDIKDMFVQPYRSGPMAAPPQRNDDPGRARNAALFDRMYGDCTKGGVAHHLVDVVWLPQKWGRRIRVTRVNGVAEKLAAVSAELDQLPARFDRFLFPSAGAYNCRVIAGTTRTSAHGHGIAIDIATGPAHYWQWAGAKAGGAITYRNAIPQEIVEVFERHGFIWGGKWYHYDTMHFEYRPEIIAAGTR